MSTTSTTSATAAAIAAGTAPPSVAVVAKDQPANMIVRIRLRPNNDEKHDQYATYYIQATTTAADISAWVAQEKTRVAAEYQAAQLASATLLAAIK